MSDSNFVVERHYLPDTERQIRALQVLLRQTPSVTPATFHFTSEVKPRPGNLWRYAGRDEIVV